MDWIWGGFFLAALGILIVITELIRKKNTGKPEVTRKVIHVVTGVFLAVTPFILQTYYPIIVIACIFIVIDYFAVKKGFLKSYNGDDRNNYGTVYYPAAFLILTLLLWDHYKVILVASILILAIADPMAAISGKISKNPVTYILGGEQKSLQGSLIMFITSAIIIVFCFLYSGFLDKITLPVSGILWIAGLSAIIATLCEALSYKGSDNFSVPVGAAFIMHYMLSHSGHNSSFIIGFALALIIAIVSFYLRFLEPSGVAATYLLGVVVFGIGQLKFSVPLLVFFVTASILSKVGKQRKQKFDNIFEKSSQRDIGQVLANGGVAGIIVLFWNYFPHESLYYIFLGAIAAANADTYGTEIGVFSKTKPRNILNFKPVSAGASGGVTLLGSAGAIAGSILIAGNALLYNKIWLPVILISISGFLGSIIDSIIGATIQAQYKCPACGKITEKAVHCKSYKTQLVSGYQWVNNDVVNAFCTISGALFTWFLIKIFVY